MKKNIIKVICIVVVICAIGFVAYVIWQKNNSCIGCGSTSPCTNGYGFKYGSETEEGYVNCGVLKEDNTFVCEYLHEGELKETTCYHNG